MENYTVQVFENYQTTLRSHSDTDKQWRWRVLDASGKVVASCGPRLYRKREAIRMVGELFPDMTVSQPEIEGQGMLF